LAKNEDGEFELILGNRQLISVFLIVVILLGVFFSMGYIVGRNSAPVAAESAHETKVSTPTWGQVNDPASAATAKTADTSAPAAEPAPTPAVESASRAVEAAQSAPPAASAKAAKSKPSPLPTASAAPATPATGDLSPGDYWQVVATARPDAEIISEALSKKGFHAVVAPAPKDGIFRVLVGPLKDASTQAQTRTALEAAGFKNPIVRKY
jgi:cell division septation protein DedD